MTPMEVAHDLQAVNGAGSNGPRVYRCVLVNGEVIIEDDRETGLHPGRLSFAMASPDELGVTTHIFSSGAICCRRVQKLIRRGRTTWNRLCRTGLPKVFDAATGVQENRMTTAD